MLTGNIRYRIGFGRKLILQVEEVGNYEDPIDFSQGPRYSVWRDAKLEDLDMQVKQVEYEIRNK